MRSGELYDFRDAEIMQSLTHAKKICAKLQGISIHDPNYRKWMRELIPQFPDSALVCPPFFCDHGNGIVMGEHVFVNFNCIMLDGGYIRIGRHTRIGPNCQFYTPHHPIAYLERRNDIETALPINIGEDCWIGGNVTICPGVSIGDRCIIGAGSVVVHDIPDDCMAAGNPAVIKKSLKEINSKIE